MWLLRKKALFEKKKTSGDAAAAVEVSVILKHQAVVYDSERGHSQWCIEAPIHVLNDVVSGLAVLERKPSVGNTICDCCFSFLYLRCY